MLLEKKLNIVCVCLCVYSITNTFEMFTLNLLSSLMISGPNTPFYKALIEPKIGSDFSSSVGYDKLFIFFNDLSDHIDWWCEISFMVLLSSQWEETLTEVWFNTGLIAAPDRHPSPLVFRAWQRPTLTESNTSLPKPSTTSLREYSMEIQSFFKQISRLICESRNYVRMWMFQNRFWRGAGGSSAT